MQLKLYATTDKPNTINKKLTDKLTLTVNVLEPVDILNPTIKLTANSTIYDCNYAYIALYKRYYFIKKIVVEKGFMFLTLDVDVLESFKTDILNYNGIIERQEYDYNLWLEDKEVSAYSKNLIQYKKFPNTPFQSNITASEKKFVLITTSD